MPIQQIDPSRREMPAFTSDSSLDRRIVDYLRAQKADYALTRLRTEISLQDDLNSQIHSLTGRDLRLQERKSILLADQSSYRAFQRPRPPGDDVRLPSLFRKPPGSDEMVEATPAGYNEARLASIAVELEEISGEITRLREQRAALDAKAGPLERRVAAMKKFINQRMASRESLRILPLPKVDPKRTLDQLRETIAQLAADIKEFEAAPVPSAVAKEKATRWVNERARPPYTAGLLDPEDGRVDLPRIIAGDREEIDVLGIALFCNRDALISALHKQIDEAADDGRALDQTARAAAIREAKQRIIETERLEEAAVWAALQAGTPVTLRGAAPAQAILSVE